MKNFILLLVLLVACSEPEPRRNRYEGRLTEITCWGEVKDTASGAIYGGIKTYTYINTRGVEVKVPMEACALRDASN